MADQSTCASAGPKPSHSSADKRSIKNPTGWNSFFQSVAPDVTEQLGDSEIGQVSKVVGAMSKQLSADVRKDWKDKAQCQREELDMGIAEEEKCPSRNTTFKRKKDMKYHRKGCHECICEICHKQFNHEQKLKRHKNKEHNATYKCGTCQKSFAEKRNLKRHESTH
ncbi:GDNF-inducible zinc finger protein 1-like [Nematostella vectensis]|uniref:GDNF-inducible zinc finger protein 1-like n=1 Tax=Nematostella vectensis TaxID=45351 RepID=UPI00138F9D75|nr:GDNF-inducible zinc finger protein 1-like [Nematostella vectensis]XP_048589097.1 GDNF-inducible zinc finger protein 1-like [Nematostella vectensis]